MLALTFVGVSPVPEGADGVYVEAVLLLADGRISLLHLGDVGLAVGFPAVLGETLLLERGPLLLRQLVEGTMGTT